MLQQLPKQELRVRQHGPCADVVPVEKRLVRHDRDKGLAEGSVDAVVFDKGYKQVICRESAGFRVGKLCCNGGKGGGAGERIVPDCQVPK